MVPRHIGTCRISVDTHANSPTRQIPSCTCSVRAHPARVMHAACDGSGWEPTSPRLSRPARGSPHSHAPHHGSRPRRTRGRDAPAVLPPPPRRQAPLAHPLPAPSRAHVAMGVGLPCMHGDVARTHGLYVAVVAVTAVWRGAAVLHCSSCWRGRTVRYVPAVTSQPLRPSRYVPAGTREHPMRAPLPWRGARMQAHQCMHAHFCTSHLYTFVCLMSPLA